ncbi:unnamed protein product [Jaminaea pallidilutea]
MTIRASDGTAFSTTGSTEEWGQADGHRASQRFSLSPSIASSTTSAANSDAGEECHNAEWQMFSLEQQSQVGHVQSGDIEGLTTAYSQALLAGPCSFSTGSDLIAAVHDALPENAGVSEQEPVPSINLQDFIAAGDPSAATNVSPRADSDHLPCSQTTSYNASWAAVQAGSGYEQAEPRLTITSSGTDSQASQEVHGAGQIPSLAMQTFFVPQDEIIGLPSSTNVKDHVKDSTWNATSALKEGTTLRPPQHSTLGRSSSFSGRSNVAGGRTHHDHHVAMPNSVSQPHYIRPQARPDNPLRSFSFSHVLDGQSCNPALVTPGSSQSPSSFASFASTPLNGDAFDGHGRPHTSAGTFTQGSCFLDSPVSSTLSSPAGWDHPLPVEDFNGEETYQASAHAMNSGAALSVPDLTAFSPDTMQHALPSAARVARTRSYHRQDLSSPATSIASARDDLAGAPLQVQQPFLHRQFQLDNLRSSSAQAAACSQARSMPLSSFGSPYHDPYTGVITKRSRGRRVPSKPEEMTNIGKSGKVYTCKVPGCGKLFKRSEHLKRHIRSIHTDEKPFLCEICHKRFSRHDNLNQHMRVHGVGAGSGFARSDNSTSALSSSSSSVGAGESPELSYV